MRSRGLVRMVFGLGALCAVGCGGPDVDYPPPPMPMQVEVSDIAGTGHGTVSFSFFGLMPQLPPDEQGNTPAWTEDTTEDAPILVSANLMALIGDRGVGSSGLRLTKDHFSALMQGEKLRALDPEESPDEQLRPHAPLNYRDSDDAVVSRTITDVKLVKLNGRAVRIELGLDGENHSTNPSDASPSPGALLSFTGPLELRCNIRRDRQPVEDINWQTPFCARVKAEFGLARYVD